MFPIAESFEQKFSFSGQTNKYIVQWRFLHLFVLIIRILRERCIECLMSSDMSNALFCAKTAGADAYQLCSLPIDLYCRLSMHGCFLSTKQIIYTVSDGPE